MTAVELITQVGVSFAGGLASGFLAPFVAQTKDRRLTRAQLAERLGDIEIARTNRGSVPDLRVEKSQLNSAVIAAHFPPHYVESYLYWLEWWMDLRINAAKYRIIMDTYAAIQSTDAWAPDFLRFLNSFDMTLSQASEGINRLVEIWAESLIFVLRYPGSPCWYRLTLRRRIADRARKSRRYLAFSLVAGSYKRGLGIPYKALMPHVLPMEVLPAIEAVGLPE